MKELIRIDLKNEQIISDVFKVSVYRNQGMSNLRFFGSVTHHFNDAGIVFQFSVTNDGQLQMLFDADRSTGYLSFFDLDDLSMFSTALKKLLELAQKNSVLIFGDDVIY